MNNETVPETLAGSPATTSIKPMGEVIQIDQNLVREHLDKVVRATLEETLNTLLDAEADQLCGAKGYEHNPERVDTRAGHYECRLHTKVGEVTLKVPKLRSLPFETAIVSPLPRHDCTSENEQLSLTHLRADKIDPPLCGVGQLGFGTLS